MALHAIENKGIRSLQPVKFEQVHLKERSDLQRLFRDQIDIVVEDGMVLAEEFGSWDDSSRRIDLLVLDKDANLVVVELKRTDNGGHMELQALRYAAMVSTMTFAQAVEAHEEYLRQRGSSVNAKDSILEFLGWEEETERRFSEVVRIVLVSADFSKEITTTALWLNEQGLDIRCVRLKPYELNSQIVLDVQQLIPLPEAQDYVIRVGNKRRTEQSVPNRDWDLESFMDELRKESGEDVARLARSIYDWSLSEFGNVVFSKETKKGRFGPTLSQDGPQTRVFLLRTDGRFGIRFIDMKAAPWIKDRAVLDGYRQRLNKIPGMALSEEDLDKKRVRRLELLLDPTNLQLFKEAASWLKHTVLSTAKQPD